MKQSIGKTIRRLRLENRLTQEELAERLGVTAQAVSRWENDTGSPDISQLVPIASVFSVSTDLLLGFGEGEESEVEAIIKSAQGLIDSPASAKGVLAAWEELQRGLKRFPANNRLLYLSLEWGICLAYPENGSVYCPERAKEIYRETLRQAKLFIATCEFDEDVMRARMITILLNSAYGEYKRAEEDACRFPKRSDMTEFRMRAYVFHFLKNHAAETECLQVDLMYHLESVLDALTALGISLSDHGEHEDALKAYLAVFSQIECFFSDEFALPPLHNRERGDVHALIARCLIALGRVDDALAELEAMVDYDLGVRSRFSGEKPKSPLNSRWGVEYYRRCEPETIAKLLLEKLGDPAFAPISHEPRFRALLERAEALKSN